MSASTEPAATAGRDRDRDREPRRVRASHGFVTLGVAAAIVGVLAGIIFGTGNADHLVELLPGRAWLANDERGSITLVNGATGEPEFEMRFRDAAGDEFEVVQGPEGVFVVNRSTGEITRIDGPTQTIAGSIKVDVANEPLFLIGGGRAYLVLRVLGRIQEIDPASPDLAPIGDPIELGGAIGSAVVDDDGILAAGVVGSGEVAFVEGASVAGRVKVNPPGDPLTVTIVDDDVVAVVQDLGKKEVRADVVQASGVTSSQKVGVPAEGEIAVADKMDGGQVWLLHKGTATIAGVPVSGGEPRVLALDFAKGDDLGAPLPNGSFVYVPNFDQGALLKVDAETGAFVDVIKVGPDTEEFEAFVENGRVWGNDPVGGTAVVIDRDGNVQNVEKYKPGIPTNDAVDGFPSPLDPPDPDDEPGSGPDSGSGTKDPDDDGRGTNPTGPDRGGPLDPGVIDGGPTDAADDIERSAPRDPANPDLPLVPGAGTTVPTPGVPTPPPPPAAAVPGAPGGVSAAAGDGTATVSWLPALANGSPVTSYRVTVSTGGTQQVDGTTTSADFTGLTNGNPVSFSVHAENAIGVGPAATSNTVTPEYAIPGAPTNVNFALVQPNSAYAIVRPSWEPPTENPDAVAEYRITCNGSSSSTPFEFTAPPTARDLFLNALPFRDQYFCGIQAVAVDGTPGPDVTMTSGTTLMPFAAPPPPDYLGSRQVTRPGGRHLVECDISAPSTSEPISGYLVELIGDTGVVESREIPYGTTRWTSTVEMVTGSSYSVLFYSYWIDPVSGLRVTSESSGFTV